LTGAPGSPSVVAISTSFPNVAEPGDIAAGMREVLDEPYTYGIAHCGEHDWNRGGLPLCRD
jgi:hypothetical protein